MDYNDLSLGVGERARAYFRAHPDASIKEAHTAVGGTISNYYIYRKQALRDRVHLRPARTTQLSEVPRCYRLIVHLMHNIDQPEKEVSRIFKLSYSQRGEIIRARRFAKDILLNKIDHPFSPGSVHEKLFEQFYLAPETSNRDAISKFGVTERTLVAPRYFAEELTKLDEKEQEKRLPVTAIEKTIPNDVRDDAGEKKQEDREARERREREEALMWAQVTDNLKEPDIREETTFFGALRNFFRGGPTAPKARDRQVGGDHYASLAVQPWDAMEAWGTAEQFEGFLRFSAIGYLARYPAKNGVEDVKKAHHYLARLIEHLERVSEAR